MPQVRLTMLQLPVLALLLGLLALKPVHAQIDFMNLNYPLSACASEFGAPPVVTVVNGQYQDGNVAVSVNESDIITADIIPDNSASYETLVPVFCGPQGANYTHVNILIYRWNNNQLEYVAELKEADFQTAYQGYFPGGTLWSEVNSIAVSPFMEGALHIVKPADGAHCCPESEVTFIYQWNGIGFVLAGKPDRVPIATIQAQPLEPPPLPPPPFIIGKSFRIKHDYDFVELLAQPGDAAPALATFIGGDSVKIVDVAGEWVLVETTYTHIDGVPQGYMPATVIDFQNEDYGVQFVTVVRYAMQLWQNSGPCPQTLDQFMLTRAYPEGESRTSAFGVRTFAFAAEESEPGANVISWSAPVLPEYSTCAGGFIQSEMWVDGQQVAPATAEIVEAAIYNGRLHLKVEIPRHNHISAGIGRVLYSGNPSFDYFLAE